jgi:hypothetical protein
MSRTAALILLFLIAVLLLFPIPAAGVSTAQGSVDGSLTRGSRFTATILGLPNTSYYIWLPGTFSMTGEEYDQPPVIADSIQGLVKDPEGGPYTIGSYQYYNGNGKTIIDDVAPATASMSNTNYYGQVTTDDSGKAVVEFKTSVYTGLRSYSVKVENPAVPDDSRLSVDVTTYSRSAPTMSIYVPEQQTAAATQAQTTVITTIPKTTIATAAPTTVPPTTAPVTTLPTTPLVPPGTTATKASPAAAVVAAGALVLAVFLTGREH